MEKKTRLARLIALPTLALGAAAAHATATPIDVTTVVDNIAAQATPVALVGAAILVLYVGLKAFHWVRRALS